jgi:hypothetical protein
MIGDLKDVKEVQTNKFAESSLGKKAESLSIDKNMSFADRPLAIVYDGCKCCPVENGVWTGERGDSKWCPDKNYIPQKANPDERSWDTILKKYGIDGIQYKNGEPDFSCISEGRVEIKNFSEDRTDNFDKADIELAKQRDCSPAEIKKWRKENGYTWHRLNA